MKRLLTCLLWVCALQVQAADVRFDAHYFFQSERTLMRKNVDFKELSKYSNAVQLQVYRALKKTGMAAGNGYLVIAVRSDGEVASWLDLAPPADAAVGQQVAEAVKKVAPVFVSQGILVFGVKMSVDSPVHTTRPRPAPAAWKTHGTPDESEIEQVVLSVWPQ